MLWLQDPIGEWLRNLSVRYRCQTVWLLHVTLTLCSGLGAGECHHLFLPCILPALAYAHLHLLLPYAGNLASSSVRVQHGMIGTDPLSEWEKGHLLLDDFGKPGIVRLHA